MKRFIGSLLLIGILTGCSDGPKVNQSVAAIDCPATVNLCTVVAIDNDGNGEVMTFNVQGRIPSIKIDTKTPYIQWYMSCSGYYTLTEIHISSLSQLTMSAQTIAIKLEK